GTRARAGRRTLPRPSGDRIPPLRSGENTQPLHGPEPGGRRRRHRRDPGRNLARCRHERTRNTRPDAPCHDGRHDQQPPRSRAHRTARNTPHPHHPDSGPHRTPPLLGRGNPFPGPDPTPPAQSATHPPQPSTPTGPNPPRPPPPRQRPPPQAPSPRKVKPLPRPRPHTRRTIRNPPCHRRPRSSGRDNLHPRRTGPVGTVHRPRTTTRRRTRAGTSRPAPTALHNQLPTPSSRNLNSPPPPAPSHPPHHPPPPQPPDA